eukprot:1220782-Amphidinium_carterae.1
MRSIEILAEQIRSKIFDPDATRSGRWLTPTSGNKRVHDALIEIPPHAPEGEGTEEDSLEEGEDFTSSSDSDSGTQGEQEVATDGRMKPDTQVAVHLRT